MYKEKRSDCKLVVLALVVNVEGIIKYFNIFEGNTADNNTLPTIIDNLRKQTSEDKRAVVVIYAGIATEENLELIKTKGYDYVCVSRAKIKNYSISNDGAIRHLMTKDNPFITLQRVEKKDDADYILKVKSKGKQAKESSMKRKFEGRFIDGLNRIQASLEKKGGLKNLNKVHQRIG